MNRISAARDTFYASQLTAEQLALLSVLTTLRNPEEGSLAPRSTSGLERAVSLGFTFAGPFFSHPHSTRRWRSLREDELLL